MLSINNTTEGYLKNVEIKGNTIQDSLGVGNLADIKSVGDKVEGQDLYEIPLLSVGKNICPINYVDNLQVNLGDIITRKICDLKLKVGSTYSLSHKEGTDVVRCRVYYKKDDGTYAFISDTATHPIFTVTEKRNYFLVAYSFSSSVTKISEVMLSESDKLEVFESYKENKLTILSPCQLEKGDVLKEVDGVWGVEKVICDEYLTSSNTIISHGNDLTNTMLFRFTGFSRINGILLSNIFEVSDGAWGIDKELIYDNTIEEIIDVRINRSRLKTEDLEGFKEWLNLNVLFFKYRKLNPTFVPLPNSQQVKLRTFAPKTNISFLTEIEGTIKADVPKSLGATVNVHTKEIDNIYTELDRVKKLEQSTVSTVTTDKDFVSVQETTQGYFEDVELNGRTLVNKFTNFKKDYQLNSVVSQNNKGITLTATNSATHSWFKADGLEVGKIYTLSLLVKTSTIDNNLFIDQGDNKEIVRITNGVVGVLCKTFKYEGGLIRFKSSNNSNGVVDVDNIVILEGDHTQNQPSYFTGLASVGEGTDEIVVSSSLGSGTLIEYFEQGTCNVTTGLDEVSLNRVRSNLVLIEGGCDYSLGYNKDLNQFRAIFLYDASKNLSRFLTVTQFKALSNEKYFKVVMSKIGDVPTVPSDMVDIMLNKGTTSKPYTPHKTDKKKLLYFDPQDNTWKKPILDEFSTVKKGSDGVYRYYKRGEKVVFDGGENWNKSGVTGKPLNSFGLDFSKNAKGGSNTSTPSIICDKLKVDTVNNVYYAETQGITLNANNWIYISVPNTIDTNEKFKADLQANPKTVVYQLAQEEVYECQPIDLITYANETNYMVKSGVLSPKSTLKVHNNIANVVSLLQKKVSLLESNISSYVITQNRLMLTGRYSSDTSEFKIDNVLPVISEKSTSVDYDLYNLLKGNILVGKENYDKVKMEEMIDFYVGQGNIDWDMWDELFILIEIQHAPPVEETPVI